MSGTDIHWQVEQSMQVAQKGQSDQLAGVQALVVGLAREGTALARFLVQHGSQVTVTDIRPAGELGTFLDALADLPVCYALGGHPPTLLDDQDIVLVSPGVPLEIPLLSEARRRGLPLSSETRLFTRLCPARVVGITGSSGKTTTTALLGEILAAAGFPIWVGGNIGQPLIAHLEEIEDRHIVVMELSSFQLDFFAPWPAERTHSSSSELAEALFDPSGWSPPIAAILNVTPNHLDRHGTMSAYIAAKRQILAHQHDRDMAILNLDNPITREMAVTSHQKRRILWFSTNQEVKQGACLQDGALVVRWEGRQEVVCRTEDLRLLGHHNLANALAACALGTATAAPIEAVRQAVTTFRGVEHRLELCSQRLGVRWYDDSIATTPERAAAALRAFPEDRIVLLAGGRDKHLAWDELAELVWQRVEHLILFGEAAELIEEAVRNAPAAQSGVSQLHQAGTLESAVKIAAEVAKPGAVVLLSPGGTSFDAYRDFAARGDHFEELVRALG